MKNILIVIIISLGIISCDDLIIKRKNNEDDIKAAFNLSERYYNQIKYRRLDSIDIMLNQNDVKPEEAKKVILKLIEGYGNLQKIEPLTGSSDVELRNGRIRNMTASIVSNAYYEKATFKETLTFKLINDSLKISSYQFELIP